MARMAVKLSVPIESLTSLGALLHPDVVELVIDAYWQKNGDEPTICTIDLGKKCCEWPARPVAWTKPHSSVSMTCERRWKSIAERV